MEIKNNHGKGNISRKSRTEEKNGKTWSQWFI